MKLDKKKIRGCGLRSWDSSSRLWDECFDMIIPLTQPAILRLLAGLRESRNPFGIQLFREGFRVTVCDREIGNWNRFRNRRQVGSYTGLCPGEYSSGNTRLQGCVTKHGNPRLRAALVELAWPLVRFQPDYKPVVKWRKVLQKGALATGAARKKAIVAVARQLAVDLWRIRTGRLSPEQLGLSI